MIELSIIVLGYNQKNKVLNLLKSIEAQVNPPFFEVIYTDDGSEDDTIDFLQKQSFQFSLTIADFNPIHSNRSVARNRGAKIAKSDWLLFLDGDGELNEIFLQEMWRSKTSNEIRQSALQVHPDARCPARIYEVYRSTAYRFGSKPFDPRLLQSGCFLIEKSLFWSFGGFQEDFMGRSGEDVAFGVYLGKSGIVARSVPTAIFFHNHYRSIEQLYHVKFVFAAQGIPRILKISEDFFTKVRLHSLFQPSTDYPSQIHQIILKVFLKVTPIQLLMIIAERFNTRWTGKTIIPFLCYHATMMGFENYVKTGIIESQDAG